MKLQRSNIDKIIFDMDGVVTGEYTYWDAAALTVYELLYSNEYYGKRDIDREWCIKNLRRISNTIFCHGKTVEAVKKLGVNTNWDLAYLVFCVSQYLDPDMDSFEDWHFESVCMFIENITINPPELYVAIEGLIASALPGEVGCYKRTVGKLWNELLNSFQKWYHGDNEIQGIKVNEEPIVPLDELKKTLGALKDAGFTLGIGTGRPKYEIIFPLEKWGLISYFDEDSIATYDDVCSAEKNLPNSGQLAKPHPFIFRKATFGDKYEDKDLVNDEFGKILAKRCLVVGDAPSDMMAAKMGGFPFAAVLTGVEGEKARGYFEENQVEFILDSVLDLKIEE